MKLIEVVNEKLKKILMGEIPDLISMNSFEDDSEKELCNNINTLIKHFIN